MDNTLPLLGVKAYVDAQSDRADHSEAVAAVMKKLGAVVYDKLLPTVTHVVFKDGSKATAAKAQRYGAHLVNVNWVESCRQSNERVPEYLHSTVQYSDKKKQKSMQPRDYETEVQNASEKLARIKKKQKSPILPPLNIIADRINLNQLLMPRTPPSLQPRINRLREMGGSSSKPSTPSRAVETAFSFHGDNLGSSPNLRPSQRVKSRNEVIVPMSVCKSPSRPDHNLVVPETPIGLLSQPLLLDTPSKELSDMNLCTPQDTAVDNRAISQSNSLSPTLDWDANIDSFLNQSVAGSPLPPESQNTLASQSVKNASGYLSTPASTMEFTRAHCSTILEDPPPSKPVPPRKSLTNPPPARKSLGSNLHKRKFIPPATVKPHTKAAANSVSEILSLHSQAVSSSQSQNTSDPDGVDVCKLDTAFSKLKPPRRSMPAHSGVTPLSNNLKKLKAINSASVVTIVDQKESQNSTAKKKVKKPTKKVSKQTSSQENINPNSSIKSSKSTSKSHYSLDGSTSNVLTSGSRRRKRVLELSHSTSAGSETELSVDSRSSIPSNHNESKRRRKANVASQSADSGLDSTSQNAGKANGSQRNVREDNSADVSDTEDGVWTFSSTRPLNKKRRNTMNICPASRSPMRSVENLGNTRQPAKDGVRTQKVQKGRVQSSPTTKLRHNVVLTSLHSGTKYCERGMVKSIIKKLGDYDINTLVDSNTTHVICGDDRRTLNVLKGISQGCLIVSVEWVLRSLEIDDWIEDESNYLMGKAFSGANPQRRHIIQTKGNSLFAQVGPIYVSHGTNPPTQDLMQLVRLNGGQVVKVRRASKVVVAPTATEVRDGRPVVKSDWILDCVTTQRLLSYAPYMWHPDSSSSDDGECDLIFNS